MDKEINKRRKKNLKYNIKVKQVKEYNINFTRSNILSLGAFLLGVEILGGDFAIKFFFR